MNLVATAIRDWTKSVADGWNRFWFTPCHGETLAVIRIAAGAMLFYTHLVWSLGLEDFFTSNGWLASSERAPWAVSHFWEVDSTATLWTLHIIALVVFAMMTVGLYTRAATVLAFLFASSYMNRALQASFGLDQLNVMLAMYLMLAPAGQVYSVDAWRRRRKAAPEPGPSGAMNVVTRLIQLHMCIIYFFAGTSKLAGGTWWDGYAMWLSVANLEYQSLDMTWLAHWPRTVAALTHISVLWEVTYFALVWPKMTRPVVLILAVLLHLGIAMFMGMITFGTIMIVANMAFLSPDFVRGVVERLSRSGRTAELAPA